MFWEKIVELLLNMPPFTLVFPDERGVFVRFGTYRYEVDPGFHWKIPWFDRIIKVYITPQEVDLVNQSILDTNGVAYAVSGVLRYNIEQAHKATYHVHDYENSLSRCAMRVISGYISRVCVKDVGIGQIEEEVLEELKLEAEDWGISVSEFGLSDLVPCRAISLISNT
jgi:regulator of protease activity HflC (stomatin/prohibitin superfamily)